MAWAERLMLILPCWHLLNLKSVGVRNIKKLIRAIFPHETRMGCNYILIIYILNINQRYGCEKSITLTQQSGNRILCLSNFTIT